MGFRPSGRHSLRTLAAGSASRRLIFCALSFCMVLIQTSPASGNSLRANSHGAALNRFCSRFLDGEYCAQKTGTKPAQVRFGCGGFGTGDSVGPDPVRGVGLHLLVHALRARRRFAQRNRGRGPGYARRHAAPVRGSAYGADGRGAGGGSVTCPPVVPQS